MFIFFSHLFGCSQSRLQNPAPALLKKGRLQPAPQHSKQRCFSAAHFWGSARVPASASVGGSPSWRSRYITEIITTMIARQTLSFTTFIERYKIIICSSSHVYQISIYSCSALSGLSEMVLPPYRFTYSTCYVHIIMS